MKSSIEVFKEWATPCLFYAVFYYVFDYGAKILCILLRRYYVFYYDGAKIRIIFDIYKQ